MGKIAVFGDLSVDTVIVPIESKGDRNSWFTQKSCRCYHRGGSAWLAGSIIHKIREGKDEVFPKAEREITERTTLTRSLPESFATLRLFPKFSKDKTNVYRLGESYGWDRVASAKTDFEADLNEHKSSFNDVDLLVLTDGGGNFREQDFSDRSWGSLLNPKSGIVMLMSSPLADGNLWQALCERQALSRTALVVSADCLRGSGVNIAFNASAEQVIMDFRREMAKGDVLEDLVQCRFLVVHFDDGIVCWDKAKKSVTSVWPEYPECHSRVLC